MSIFCLILHPEPRQASVIEIDRMLDPIAYAGPGGRACWTDGRLGIGTLRLTAVSGASDGRDADVQIDDDLVVVADARLDDRQHLSRQLDRPASLSDSALIAAAWRRWGRACGLHLLGDYAFVVYDRRQRCLVGISDALGARRLFHGRLLSGSLVMASEEACLIAYPELVESWDQAGLAFWLQGAPCRTRSIFSRIGVIACGQRIELTHGRCRISHWWEPTAVSRIRYRRVDDYAAHYRELLDDCVRDRIGADGRPILCELSGGMDSSSVTAAAVSLARRQRRTVSTISYCYPGYPSSDDCGLAAETRSRLGITDGVELDACALLSGGLPIGFGPRAEAPGAFDHVLQQLAVQAARERGASIILTGLGGDDLTCGSLLASLLASVRRANPRFIREIMLTASRRNEPLRVTLKRRLLMPLGRHLLGDRIADAMRGCPTLQRTLPSVLGGSRETACLVADVRQQVQSRGGNDPALRHLLGRLHIASSWFLLDALRLTASSAGISAAAPLMDRRLYAFVAGTPADLWYREGLSKYLVRLATRGILPDSVRNVAVKVVIDAPTQAIWRAHQAWIIDVLEAASALPRAKPLASGLVQLAQQVRGGVTLAPRDGFTLAFALWLTRYEAEEEKRMRSC